MTSTISETVIDTSWLEEFDRACTPWSIDCGQTATWIWTTQCCGIEIPLCQSHDETLQKQIKEYGDIVQCMSCGVSLLPGIDKLFDRNPA